MSQVKCTRSMLKGLTLACGLLAPACSPPPAPSSSASGESKVQVAVSVAPQAFLVDRIGGDRVDVMQLVRPGDAPSTYDPSPRQMVALGEARLYVKVGHPDFPFEKRHLGRMLAGRSELRVVDMAEDVSFLPSTEHDGGAHEGETDPHVWLSPRVVEGAARRIAQALSRIDPDYATQYESRLETFLRELEALDEELRTLFADLENRRFLVQHPAWGYFAAHYGLEQKAIESGGKEPGLESLLALIEEARQDGVRVIFVQRGISDQSGRTIAREIGAEVIALDPLAYDWFDNLRRVAASFQQALGD